MITDEGVTVELHGGQLILADSRLVATADRNNITVTIKEEDANFYKDLLTHYIAWVMECEGVNVITCGGGYHRENYFSPEQWAELERLVPLAKNLYLLPEPQEQGG